jgi:hypothetical protein
MTAVAALAGMLQPVPLPAAADKEPTMPTDLTHTAVHVFLLAASFALFVISARAPAIARLLVIAALAIGAATSVAAAFAAPALLASLVAYAPLAAYREVVDRALVPHPTLTLAAVGVAAALCATGLAIAGRPARWASAAAIALLLAIVPFGAGTAFPAPLFAVAALWLMSRSTDLLDKPALLRGHVPRAHALALRVQQRCTPTRYPRCVDAPVDVARSQR